jgi:hypothetical protein
MTLLPLLTLALGIAPGITPGAPDPIAGAIRQGLLKAAPSGVTRVEVASHRDRIPSGCTIADAKPLGQVLGSGAVTLKLEGTTKGAANRMSCSGWSWVQARFFSNALVTTRRIATGEALAGAFEPRERELLGGRIFALAAPPDAVAAYSMPADAVLEPQNMRSPGQIPGRTIAVELRYGDLVVETQGRTVPCALNAACALLPSGKQVTGAWTNGRLEVSLP